jgi:hypothetical protein
MIKYFYLKDTIKRILLVLQGVLLEEIKATYDVACKKLNTDRFGPATGFALRATVF